MVRTFIIDDDRISTFLTEQALLTEGVSDVSVFLSPEEALSHVVECLPDRLPDFILLDLNMPKMSGWDVLDALAPYERQLQGRTRVYILTSSLDPQESARSENYPLVRGCLHKPLECEDVQAILAQIEDETEG